MSEKKENVDEAAQRPIGSQEQFDEVKRIADLLADVVGQREDHPLSPLFDSVLSLLGDWEDKHPLLELQDLTDDHIRKLAHAHGLKHGLRIGVDVKGCHIAGFARAVIYDATRKAREA